MSAVHDISSSKLVTNADEMCVDLFDGTKIQLLFPVTKVDLRIIFNMVYDKEKRKWKPHFHCGIFASRNQFIANDVTYKHCLLHFVPVKYNSANVETTLKVCLCDTWYAAAAQLALYVGTQTYQLEILNVGDSNVSLAYLADEAEILLENAFNLRGIKEKVKIDCPMLVEDGETNCLHAAICLINRMNTGVLLHFNECFMQIMYFCFRRVVDMVDLKFVDPDSYPFLVEDIRDCLKFTYAVDKETHKKIAICLKQLLDEKAHLKTDDLVKLFVSFTGFI